MALDREISMLRNWLWTLLGIPKLSEKTLNAIIEHSVQSNEQFNDEILSELALVAGKDPSNIIEWHQRRIEQEENKVPLRPIIDDN
jgi:hypothetical protein